ncbi:MAG: hypothetical protein KAJ48_04425 [Elusimicrobiales bacterium]|nr:hypothetical protein [Elusimicrobiales bacterium]
MAPDCDYIVSFKFIHVYNASKSLLLIPSPSARITEKASAGLPAIATGFILIACQNQH